MEKSKIIKVKVTEKEYDDIKKAARKRGETISGYVRPRLKEDFTEGWIKKSEVQKILSNIAFLIDKYQLKNMRFAEVMRKELKKLWEKL